MICVYCGNKTIVTNSRFNKVLHKVWRRRQCAACMVTFTTFESLDYPKSYKFSSMDSYKPFSRDVLFISIYQSCAHRKAAIDDSTAITDTVMGRLTKRVVQDGVIKREDVIKNCYEVLKHFDSAAASYYRAYHPLS
jgi:transcriptional regulator NrdR family protein